MRAVCPDADGWAFGVFYCATEAFCVCVFVTVLYTLVLGFGFVVLIFGVFVFCAPCKSRVTAAVLF